MAFPRQSLRSSLFGDRNASLQTGFFGNREPEQGGVMTQMYRGGLGQPLNLFNPPKPILPPPNIEDAAAIIAERRRRRKGRAATVLTGSEGAGLPSTATAALLGE